jgi:hypothetical protein
MVEEEEEVALVEAEGEDSEEVIEEVEEALEEVEEALEDLR